MFIAVVIAFLVWEVSRASLGSICKLALSAAESKRVAWQGQLEEYAMHLVKKGTDLSFSKRLCVRPQGIKKYIYIHIYICFMHISLLVSLSQIFGLSAQ